MIDWFAGIVFYVVVTPAAWVLRALGRDPLGEQASPRLDSYWSHSTNTRPTDMTRQR